MILEKQRPPPLERLRPLDMDTPEFAPPISRSSHKTQQPIHPPDAPADSLADSRNELEIEFDHAVADLLADTAAIHTMFDLGIDIPHWTRHRARFGAWPIGLSANGKFVQPAVAYDDIVDLVEWSPNKPASWTLKLGLAVLLGEEAADRAALLDEPLAVYPTPLAWLLAFGNGACVVDWDCYLPFHLSATRMLVDDRSLNDRLTRALTVPPITFEIREVAA